MGIRIEVDNPQKSYFAGEAVAGRVVVQSAKPENVKEFKILLEGAAKVEWSERIPGDFLRYTSEEVYTSEKVNLSSGGGGTIPEGSSTYPFSFRLQANLPSSFKSFNGRITYVLKAELKGSSSKFKAHLPFTVNGILDLNKEVGVTQPQECSRVKGSNFLVCRRGQLSFLLKLPTRSGFVPGEIVDFIVEITNASNKKVQWTKASLQQVTTIYAMGVSKDVTRILGEIQGPSVDEGEHETWASSLSIPPVPPTNVGGACKIVDLKYCLHFEMKISGRAAPLRGIQLPVTIGSIPLRSTFQDFQPRAENVDAVLPGYPNLPPPSYSEAMQMGSSSPQMGVANKGVSVHDSTSPLENSLDDFVPNYIIYTRRT